ncbi:MAG: hypothetical protein ABI280_14345 [Ginsengibacter sp.]
MENKDYSRRKFFNKCFSTGSVLLGGTIFLNSCGTNDSSGNTNESSGNANEKKQSTSEDPCNDLSGVSDVELKKRESLGYVTKSPVPESYCGNCSLYILPKEETGCGGCMLFKGPVHVEGHCVQWAAKAT